MREPASRSGPALRLGFLLLAAAMTAIALFAVPPAKGPPAIALGLVSAMIGVVLGTGFAKFVGRIDPAPPKLQQRRSIALLAAGVLIATSAAFLANASRLTDIGTGVELPILAVSASGEMTTINPDMATNLPMTVKPRSKAAIGVGGCIWLAEKRGFLGAGIFEIAEARPCSPIRGSLPAGHAPSLILPENGRKTDWRWAS